MPPPGTALYSLHQRSRARRVHGAIFPSGPVPGVTDLSAALETATGKVLGRCFPRHRHAGWQRSRRNRDPGVIARRPRLGHQTGKPQGRNTRKANGHDPL
jgi:hypothetical protein